MRFCTHLCEEVSSMKPKSVFWVFREYGGMWMDCGFRILKRLIEGNDILIGIHFVHDLFGDCVFVFSPSTDLTHVMMCDIVTLLSPSYLSAIPSWEGSGYSWV